MKLKEDEIILTYYDQNLVFTEATERYLFDIINEEQLTEFIDVLCKTIWRGNNFSKKHIDLVMNNIAISLNDEEIDVYEKWQLSKQIDQHIERLIE